MSNKENTNECPTAILPVRLSKCLLSTFDNIIHQPLAHQYSTAQHNLPYMDVYVITVRHFSTALLLIISG